MQLVLRLALTLSLLVILAFCGFGFLATFEPPGFLFFRLLYASVALGCLLTIVAIWYPDRRVRGHPGQEHRG
jgi:hypothetical protein